MRASSYGHRIGADNPGVPHGSENVGVRVVIVGGANVSIGDGGTFDP
jgi:hypothetical protein